MTGNGIKVGIAIEDEKGSIQKLRNDASGLRKAFDGVAQSTDAFNARLHNAASAAFVYQQITTAVDALYSSVKALNDAYAESATRETQITVLMKNRMSATEAEIQAVKEFVAAQQALGVVGDEEQLAGLQQLTTYLRQKESITALLPAMNDLIVRQEGLNATSAGAISIARAMGRAMEGQTMMLTRMGISFTDAQQQMLEYGTEAEKARALSDAIAAAVGGMNEALARTDAGKAKQTANAIGDWQEEAGALVSGVLPVLQFCTAINGTVMMLKTLSTTMRPVIALMHLDAAATMASTAMTRMFADAKKSLSTVVGILAGRLRVSRTAAAGVAAAETGMAGAAAGATVATVSLTAAVRAFLSATVIGAVLVALGYALNALIEYLTGAEEKMGNFTAAEQSAAEEADELARAVEEERRAVTDGTTAYNIAIKRCKEFKGTQEEERKIVTELNNTYGEKLGYCRTVSEWYNILTANSEAYCKQLQLEARTERITRQMKANANKIDRLIYDDEGNKIKYDTRRSAAFYTVNRDGEKLWYGSGTLGLGHEPVYFMPDSNEFKAFMKAATNGRNEIGYVYGKSEQQLNAEAVGALESQNEQLQAKLNESYAEIDSMSFVKSDSSPEVSTEPTAQTAVAERAKTELEQVREAIKSVKDEYVKAVRSGADDSEVAVLHDKIEALTEQEARIKAVEAAATRPSVIDSAEDYSAEIEYQTALLKSQNGHEAKATEENIRRLKAAQEQYEASALTIDEQASMEREIESSLSNINAKLKWATGEERNKLLLLREQLKTRQQSMSLADREAVSPIDPEGVRTLREADEAISILTERMRDELPEAAKKTQEQIDALNERRSHITAASGMASRIEGYEEGVREIREAKNIRVAVEGVGFESLNEKLKELQKLLREFGGDMTSGQRRQLEGLIEEYRSYQRTAARSLSTVRRGWGQLTNVTDGVERMTEALSGNGSAWDKIKSIVSGALSIYDGVTEIVKIVEMLTAATMASAAAKGSESVADAAVGATGTAVMAQHIAQTATAKTLAASFRELAAAEFFAAYAYIPFAGLGIASANVAAMMAGVSAAAIPLAKGGIAYGPQLALVGEYAGAGSNPEVIAPLDKLRGLLNDGRVERGSGVKTVRLVASGRDLRATINAYDILASRR